MAFSETEMISMSIQLLNRHSISSIAEGGVFSQSAKSFFKLTLGSVIAKSNWRFATNLIVLDKLNITPVVSDWTYIYLLPGDYVAMYRTYPIAEFQIYGGRQLYSNVDNLTIEYRYVPIPELLPDYFVEYFIYELALKLTFSGTGKVNLSQAFKEEMARFKADALSTDAKSHPTTAMQQSPLQAARYGGLTR